MMRTTTKTVIFQRPFVLEGFPELLPAGTYTVDTEEEQLESLLSIGWRRVSTTLRVRIDGSVEFRTIDPDALHEALMRDGAQNAPGTPTAKFSAKTRLNRARQFATYPAHRKKE
jgi:hypothetical protein